MNEINFENRKKEEEYKESNKIAEKQNMISLSVYNVGRQKCVPGYKW